MPERGSQCNLAAKARDAASRRRGAQHLDRESLPIALIAGLVHDRHSSPTDWISELVSVRNRRAKTLFVESLIPERREPRSRRLFEIERRRFDSTWFVSRQRARQKLASLGPVALHGAHRDA